jgi:hypothetical protein
MRIFILRLWSAVDALSNGFHRLPASLNQHTHLTAMRLISKLRHGASSVAAEGRLAQLASIAGEQR